MKPSEKKIIFLFVAFVVLLAVIVGRLIELQIFKHDYYWKLAQDQQVFFSSIPAKRGTVYDRNLRPLAMTLPAYQVFADPEFVTDPNTMAGQLASLGLGDRRELYAKLNKQNHFVWIHRALDVETTLKLEGMGLSGLHFAASGKRTRPLGDLALNVLGHVSVDDSALGGVEENLDRFLRGKDGLRRFFKDALGKQRPCVEAIVSTPVSGMSAVLTLDAELQEVAEAELDSVVARHKARGGCVVIVDPANGDLLAIASSPREWNFAVRQVFEPGSAFKLCTIATALDLGKVDTLTVMNTFGGSLQVAGGRPIKDDHPGGVMDLREAVRRSSNIYAALTARRIGKRDFYKYMHSFGFGLKTGLGLEGESRGLLKEPDKWSGRSLETMGMGQEIGVTAIQMAMAYSAVANGGKLYKPRLVKEIIDEAGNVKESFKPRVVRTVVKKETSEVMATLLRRVVNCGTGTQAKIEGVDVAGKTGTGQKAADGVYVTGKYCSVFAGYLPASNPTMVCVAVVDEPTVAGYYGGTVCAPLFKDVMEYALMRDKSILPAQCYDIASRIKKQKEQDQADARGSKESEAAEEHKQGTYPSVVGLTLREAGTVLAAAGIKWRANGSGVVVLQQPCAESPFDAGMICSLVLGERQ